MGYAINSPWTELRKNDIERLNKIIDDEYCNELEIGRKLNIMKKFEKELEEELNNFNFDIVLKFMKDNNWEWAMYKNGKSFSAVPTKEDIIHLIKEDLFKHCLYTIIEGNKNRAGVETGGLVLELEYECNEFWINLYFDISRFIDDND